MLGPRREHATTFEAEWRARFERFARTQSSEAGVSGWSEAGLSSRMRRFAMLLAALEIPPGSSVLDLGCGAGSYVRLLAGHGHQAVGLDYSTPTLARARDADAARAGRYLGGGAYALPFRDRAFDLVVAIGVLQTLARPEAALDEIARVLTPGGWLVVEGLNALSVVAVAKGTVKRLRRQPGRLRTYSPFRLRRWLHDRGIREVGRAGIYLPPRRMTVVADLLERADAGRLIDAVPALSLVAAHSFLYVGRRSPASSSRMP